MTSVHAVPVCPLLLSSICSCVTAILWEKSSGCFRSDGSLPNLGIFDKYFVNGELMNVFILLLWWKCLIKGQWLCSTEDETKHQWLVFRWVRKGQHAHEPGKGKVLREICCLPFEPNCRSCNLLSKNSSWTMLFQAPVISSLAYFVIF